METVLKVFKIRGGGRGGGGALFKGPDEQGKYSGARQWYEGEAAFWRRQMSIANSFLYGNYEM